jgi:hypothetical protein
MRLGIRLPGPFWVTTHVNTNRSAVPCLAGGVIHANVRIAARCRDCQAIRAERADWEASPGGQEWLRRKKVSTDRQNMILGMVLTAVVVLTVIMLIVGSIAS